jgi:hypothetical protein
MSTLEDNAEGALSNALTELMKSVDALNESPDKPTNWLFLKGKLGEEPFLVLVARRDKADFFAPYVESAADSLESFVPYAEDLESDED